MRGRGEAYAAADAGADGPCAGTSCHIHCRSIGFEPPFCRNHCGGTSGGKGDREVYLGEPAGHVPRST